MRFAYPITKPRIARSTGSGIGIESDNITRIQDAVCATRENESRQDENRCDPVLGSCSVLGHGLGDELLQNCVFSPLGQLPAMVGLDCASWMRHRSIYARTLAAGWAGE